MDDIFRAVRRALVDALILERIQNYFRKALAARTQEQFDCDLFGLEWRSLRVGEEARNWRRAPRRQSFQERRIPR